MKASRFIDAVKKLADKYDVALVTCVAQDEGGTSSFRRLGKSPQTMPKDDTICSGCGAMRGKHEADTLACPSWLDRGPRFYDDLFFKPGKATGCWAVFALYEDGSCIQVSPAKGFTGAQFEMDDLRAKKPTVKYTLKQVSTQ